LQQLNVTLGYGNMKSGRWINNNNKKGKVKQSLLQAWTGSEGSRRLRILDFKTICTWRWQSCQF